MAWWRDRAHECPRCGWQGMRDPGNAECPECGDLLERRSWLDTWGLTLLILGIVAATVLFVAFFRHGD